LRRIRRLLAHPGAIAENELVRSQTKINELDTHLEPSALSDKRLDGEESARRDDQILGALSHRSVDPLNPMKRDRATLEGASWWTGEIGLIVRCTTGKAAA
jgi:hypothetical protein